MYFIERNPLPDTAFLAGSVAEPSDTEAVWAVGTYAVGQEVIRPALHRVFRCAVARTATNTLPPELDTTAWADMRPTRRYQPFGPQVRADGKLVYQNQPLQSTTGDIEYRLQQRYANAVAIFGANGATVRVQVYDQPGGTLKYDKVLGIKSPATSYWTYAYGRRSLSDRILVHGLPIFPNAEVRITITGVGSQLRAVSQIEVGKLRYLPGVDFGGVQYGITRIPKAFTTRKTEADGSTSVLIYGTSYDMSGTIALSGTREDAALTQLRGLLGRGVAYAPTLAAGYEQSLLFGILKSADVARDAVNLSSVRFEIEGLPT
jgi:hypothetical protein